MFELDNNCLKGIKRPSREANKKNRVRIAMRTRFIMIGIFVYLMMNFWERITLPLCIFTTYTPGA